MKCFLKLLTFGIIISVNFATSVDVSSDDESPRQKRAAETSSPKPYNILGMSAEKFKSLGEFNAPCVVSFRIPNPANCCIRLKCNADEICLQSFTFEDPDAFQNDLNIFFEEAKRTIGLPFDSKTERLGFKPTVLGSRVTKVTAVEDVKISKSIIAATDQIILSTGSAFVFGEPNVFASAGTVTLNFNNPASLVSSIVLEFDPSSPYKGMHPNPEYGDELCLGSIRGRASFLQKEHSNLDFLGFSSFKILLNNNTLQRLRDEGRL